MAGGGAPLPSDYWVRSSATQEVLEKLVEDDLLCPVIDHDRPEWITLGQEDEQQPPMGYIVSFTTFHKCRFGMPASRFMRSLSFYYGVKLHNFALNSIS